MGYMNFFIDYFFVESKDNINEQSLKKHLNIWFNWFNFLKHNHIFSYTLIKSIFFKTQWCDFISHVSRWLSYWAIWSTLSLHTHSSVTYTHTSPRAPLSQAGVCVYARVCVYAPPRLAPARLSRAHKHTHTPTHAPLPQAYVCARERRGDREDRPPPHTDTQAHTQETVRERETIPEYIASQTTISDFLLVQTNNNKLESCPAWGVQYTYRFL